MDYSIRSASLIGGAALITHGALKRGVFGSITMGLGGILTYFSLAIERAPQSAERRVMRSVVTVNAEPFDAFTYWRDLSQLTKTLGLPKNWKAEITHENPGHVLEFRSLQGEKHQGSGTVWFKRKKNGRGTKVHIEFSHAGELKESNFEPFREAVEAQA